MSPNHIDFIIIYHLYVVSLGLSLVRIATQGTDVDEPLVVLEPQARSLDGPKGRPKGRTETHRREGQCERRERVLI